MKKSLRICGYTTSTFKFGNDTLYLTKYDDGRFEYYGLVAVTKGTQKIEIPHGFTAKFSIGVGANFYANGINVLVTATCGTEKARFDFIHIDGATLYFDTWINIHVMGRWK